MAVELFRNSYAPAPNVSQPPQVEDTYITPDSLKPVSPIQVPSTPAPTQATSFNSYMEQLGGATETAKSETDNSFSQLMSSLDSTLTETEATNTAYGKEGGVNTLEVELNDLNAQLRGEQHALQRELEEIDKNSEGLTRGAVQDNKRMAERESLRKQADIAVIQMAKQGQYDSAKKIADRAVTAYMEKTKQKNEMLRFIYEENKEQFTKAEQREFEAAAKERDRQADNEEYRMRAEFDAKLKQNDPLYQLQVQKLRQDVSQVAFGGTLNGKPQTQAQIISQGYADRTAQSHQIITRLGDEFTDVGSYVFDARIFGQNIVPNAAKSSNRQQYEQAQRNFVNAVLRRESGAVISKEEFDNARLQYFPQPGDTPEVIKQKAENRETVINSLYLGANTSRPPVAGSIIEDANGQQYKIGEDGETLTPL